MARRGMAVAPTAHANWRNKPMGERNYERFLAEETRTCPRW